MVPKEKLKKIEMLRYLADEMLDTLAPVLELQIFNAGKILFKEGDPADEFYMIKRGKVLLEKRMSDKVTVSVVSIESGYSFGWQSLLGEATYLTNAVCAEASEIFSVKGETVTSLMSKHPAMGYLLTQRLLREVINRLEQRTDQLIRALKEYSDIQTLL